MNSRRRTVTPVAVRRLCLRERTRLPRPRPPFPARRRGRRCRRPRRWARPAPAEAAAHRHFRHGVASGDPHPDQRDPVDPGHPDRRRRPPAPGAGPRRHRRAGRSRATAASGTSSRTGRFATGARPRPHREARGDAGCGRRRRTSTGSATTASHSRTGRTRTAPAATTQSPDNLRFGIVSCANLQAGYFSAYRHLARRDDLDAVIHLGDYLYEYAPGEYGYGHDNRDIRPHQPAREMVSLADYRQRHAQYKHDPDLQDLHAEVAVHRHLGRPRGRQRPVEGRRGEPPARRGRLPRAATPGPPRVRRVDAGADGRHRRRSATAPGCSGGCGSARWPS